MNIRRFLFFLVMVSIIFFFWREMQSHWEEFSGIHNKFRWSFISMGGSIFCVSYLVATWSWLETIRVLTGKRLTFRESFAVYNASQLAKHIPGKIWSYGLQMYWLSLRGVPKMQVLSVNLVMTVSLLVSAFVIGLGHLAFNGAILPKGFAVGLFVCIAVGYIILVFGGATTINFSVTFINRVFNRKFGSIKIRTADMMAIQCWYLLSNLLFGFAGYAIALGIGEPWNPDSVFPVSASLLFADAIGFVAVITPGGLGVREVVMFSMLGKVVSSPIAILLPITIRVVTMCVDLVMGALAIWYVRSFMHISRVDLIPERDSTESQ